MKWHFFIYIKSVIILLLLANNVFSKDICGSVYDIEYGPYNYLKPGGSITVRAVEKRHFTKKVQMLRGGESGATIIGDLDYTLRKFPNHYPALWSLIKYDQKLQGNIPRLEKRPYPTSVECYMKKALEFRPRDADLRQLYGMYYHMRKDYDKSAKQYGIAEKIAPSGELYYNMGLLFFDQKEYEKAKKYAQKAYKKKYRLPGLKNKLKRAGFDAD